jgi:hypothetical protein
LSLVAREPVSGVFDSRPPDAASAAGAELGAALRLVPLAAVALGAIGFGTAALGAPVPPRLLLLLGVGALAARALPAWRRPIAVAVGGLGLAMMNPVFSIYFAALVGALMLARADALPFAVLLAIGAIWWPKTAFFQHYHQPGFWNWLNEPSLALAIFAGASWLRGRAEARQGRGGGVEPDALTFLLLYLFPSHATHPMIFAPSTLARPARIDARGIAVQLGWFLAKVAALAALRRAGAHGFLRDLDPGAAGALSFTAAWRVVAASYVETYLALAVGADVPVMIARLYGWPLAAPFRAALLAWNPVELWRRWGIYNRQFLLRVVYFPLGGNQRHRYRNVVLTFLASALFLHSGWFGSKYWEVGPGGWRDYTIYFMAQAAAVCACLALARPGGRRDDDRALHLTPGRVLGTAATQAWSALAHVLVLAQGIDLGARMKLIGRCLGL